MENLMARVAQQNTPETDAMPVVHHIVSWTKDGVAKEMTVLAADPMAAIATVRRLFEGEYKPAQPEHHIQFAKNKRGF